MKSPSQYILFRSTYQRHVGVCSAVLAVLALLSGCFATTGPAIDHTIDTKEVLVVMDMQRDFLQADGAMPIEFAQQEPTLAATNRAIAHFGAAETPVFYVVNRFAPDDHVGNWFRNSAAVAKTAGAQLDPRLSVAGPVYAKDQPDAFSNPSFDAALRERRIGRITFAGVFADQCVYWTIRGALNRGYDVTVIADAVGAGSEDEKKEALATFAEMGVRVVSSSDLAEPL